MRISLQHIMMQAHGVPGVSCYNIVGNELANCNKTPVFFRHGSTGY